MPGHPGNPAVTATFASLPPKSHPAAWEHLWNTSVTPWDRAGPSPPLRDILLSRPDLFPARPDGRRPTALVPGCGRGHDALLLASFGYHVVGLDLAETAVREARENEVKEGREGTYPLQEGVGERGEVTFVAGDFFENEFLKEAGVDKFDLIFDYTFSCALPVSQRPTWATRMATLLSPTGRLVILQFPNGKSLAQPGPPWGVNSSMYLALLTRPGEPVTCNADGEVPNAERLERTGAGLRRLALVVPERTHDIGLAEDGSVTDRVSVWGH